MPVLQLQAAEAAVSAGEQRAAHALAQRSATEPLKTALKPTDARWTGDNGPTYTPPGKHRKNHGKWQFSYLVRGFSHSK